MIRLEITESSSMGDPERAAQAMSQLKSLGVALSIDDFGAGYSSLAYLHRFSLDSLKIDRSFVAGMLDKAESRQIITTIMALGEGLGMEVVAEGVETSEQAVELGRLGCNFGQGYLFSKPIESSVAAALLDAARPPARRSDAAA